MHINLFPHTNNFNTINTTYKVEETEFGATLPDVVTDLVKNKTSGLVLVVGGACSGRTTTTFGITDAYSKLNPSALLAVNDVEARERANTVTNNPHMFAFSQLGAALRLSPDMVVAEELRNENAVREALTAAVCGNLVVVSIHAQTAMAAVERMVSMVDFDQQLAVREDLAQVLVGVVAQTLMASPTANTRVASATVCTKI